MNLTTHFTLEELTRSVDHPGIPNVPMQADIRQLRALAAHLEELRAAKCPKHGLVITSGFRSASLNVAVGGAPMSAHRFGCAADIRPASLAECSVEALWIYVKGSKLTFDQAIHEFDAAGGEWLHYGIARPSFGPARRMHFTIDRRRKGAVR